MDTAPIRRFGARALSLDLPDHLEGLTGLREFGRRASPDDRVGDAQVDWLRLIRATELW